MEQPFISFTKRFSAHVHTLENTEEKLCLCFSVTMAYKQQYIHKIRSTKAGACFPLSPVAEPGLADASGEKLKS